LIAILALVGFLVLVDAENARFWQERATALRVVGLVENVKVGDLGLEAQKLFTIPYQPHGVFRERVAQRVKAGRQGFPGPYSDRGNGAEIFSRLHLDSRQEESGIYFSAISARSAEVLEPETNDGTGREILLTSSGGVEKDVGPFRQVERRFGQSAGPDSLFGLATNYAESAEGEPTGDHGCDEKPPTGPCFWRKSFFPNLIRFLIGWLALVPGAWLVYSTGLGCRWRCRRAWSAAGTGLFVVGALLLFSPIPWR
jgi:hypothetical protein